MHHSLNMKILNTFFFSVFLPSYCCFIYFDIYLCLYISSLICSSFPCFLSLRFTFCPYSFYFTFLLFSSLSLSLYFSFFFHHMSFSFSSLLTLFIFLFFLLHFLLSRFLFLFFLPVFLYRKPLVLTVD